MLTQITHRLTYFCLMYIQGDLFAESYKGVKNCVINCRLTLPHSVWVWFDNLAKERDLVKPRKGARTTSRSTAFSYIVSAWIALKSENCNQAWTKESTALFLQEIENTGKEFAGVSFTLTAHQYRVISSMLDWEQLNTPSKYFTVARYGFPLVVCGVIMFAYMLDNRSGKAHTDKVGQ